MHCLLYSCSSLVHVLYGIKTLLWNAFACLPIWVHIQSVEFIATKRGHAPYFGQIHGGQIYQWLFVMMAMCYLQVQQSHASEYLLLGSSNGRELCFFFSWVLPTVSWWATAGNRILVKMGLWLFIMLHKLLERKRRVPSCMWVSQGKTERTGIPWV